MTTGTMPLPVLKRSFRDLSDAEAGDIEKSLMLARAGLYGNVSWEDLLQSRRILIVSEAGAGKTYECQAQQGLLWASGEAAFYLDLATLSGSTVRDMLLKEEEYRFDAWLRSQSEVATFFLDSIDELKLTVGNFEQALKRFNKALAGQLGRARVIITTRPVPIDRELITKYLPVPPAAEAAPSAEDFADVAMNRSPKAREDEGKPKLWRNVGLVPLSQTEIREFATLQGVSDPDTLLADIRERDAEEFAQRPQDLIELCSDWREHHRIRTHHDQVETNIATKLKPSTERRERAELSSEKALEGACRLALAALLTRKLTLKHSAGSDSVDASEVALDGSKILLNWSDAERATLLERPLFGFATYGRVRFHHRSVMEFLAAKRLDSLLASGASIKAIKRLLFTETAQGTPAVRPSMRAVAAWLALSRETIFNEVIARDPAIVLDHGDPQSLRPAQKILALEAYVTRYGPGGWRGLSPPRIQVHRFASPELDSTVKRLWSAGIKNEEVRGLLLKLIGAGKFAGCADIAFAIAMDSAQTVYERTLAIDALVQLSDQRLEAVANSIETDEVRWPEAIARQAIISLFPALLPVPRLSRILGRLRPVRGHTGPFDLRLPDAIETESLTPDYLDDLRVALTKLMLDGITWEESKFPHLRTRRPDLKAVLAAACGRQAAEGVRTEAWAASCLLVIRLSKDTDKKSIIALRKELASLSPSLREAVFFEEDAFLAQLHRSKDAWGRIFDLSHYGGIQLNDEKDAQWVRRRLSDPNEVLDHREMMLWAEMVLLNQGAPDPRAFLEGLKEVVSDAPSLVALIDGRLKPQGISAELRRGEALNAKRAKQRKRRAAKDHASWVAFWREIVAHPDAVFAPDRADNTVWNLWRVLERSGEKSRASGWNRRFIEAQFGKDVADKVREAMMAYWRKDKPTLRSERPDDSKDTFLIRWQLGLAAIGAEAEDPNWAKRLDEREAELACRYAPIELSGFPSWLDSLAVEHPAAVDRMLGEELSQSLREIADTNSYSMFLQNISHASAIIAALFVPRVRSWVTEVGKVDTEPNHPQSEQNLRQAVHILLTSGNDDDRGFLETIAKQKLQGGLSVPFVRIWLPVLLHLNPVAGVDAIEQGLKDVTVSKTGAGAQLFAHVFHRDRGGVAVDLGAPGFTPSLLLRLVRQAYRHVQIADDAQHEGSYSPDTRDDAERGRSAVLSAILAASGADGWAAKLEMANDPLFAHFRDRAIALAEEKAAEEADQTALSDGDFVILDRLGEAPPVTTADMFVLMRDRLDDLDDFLLQDISPRELWSSITEEHVMRREIARVLRDAGKESYTVDQEAVTADEKETDIRLRSKSGQQGTIELKLADERTGRDLFNTIKGQLLTKYMAAEDCRAGCLLITIAKERKWEHPKTGESLNFEELLAILQKEAERLSQDLGGAAKIMVKGINLRPRLQKERS